jgi:hypothetical protein
MSKTMDSIANILRASKHPFHQADDRPTKAQQHRYERRKIKEHLRVCEWWDPLSGASEFFDLPTLLATGVPAT